MTRLRSTTAAMRSPSSIATTRRSRATMRRSRSPDYPEALYNRANLLRIANRLTEAIASYEGALAGAGRIIPTRSATWPIASSACATGTKLPRLVDELTGRIREGRSIISPFVSLAFSDTRRFNSNAPQPSCAIRSSARSAAPARPGEGRRGSHARGGCRPDRVCSQAAPARGSSRAASLGGSLPRYPPLQRTHHRERGAMDRAVGNHVQGGRPLPARSGQASLRRPACRS